MEFVALFLISRDLVLGFVMCYFFFRLDFCLMELIFNFYFLCFKLIFFVAIFFPSIFLLFLYFYIFFFGMDFIYLRSIEITGSAVVIDHKVGMGRVSLINTIHSH